MTKKGFCNQSKFAERHGVSRQRVSKWKQHGYLVMVDDAVDIAASDRKLKDAGLGKFKSQSPSKPKAQTERPSPKSGVGKPKFNPENDAAAALEAGAQNVVSMAEAERRKNVALAEKREIEVALLKQELVDRRAAEHLAFSLAREHHDSWINWPARASAKIAAELGVEHRKVAATLEKHVRLELEQRAGDLERRATELRDTYAERSAG